MNTHQKTTTSKTWEWLTPPGILSKLGKFDLDPCAPINRPWDTAHNHYTIEDDGLSKKWEGRVWLNPPFGRYAIKWLQKLAWHGNGIALIAVRTETEMFSKWVWPYAEGILFLNKRPHFHHVDGSRAPFNSGASICLVAYGKENGRILSKSGLGRYLKI